VHAVKAFGGVEV